MTQGSRRGDREIQAHVAGELNGIPGLDTAHIAVVVRAGMVTLRGEVDATVDRQVAKRTVGRIPGVRAVADEMVVRDRGAPGVDDVDIADIANRRLESADGVPAGTVRAGVRGRVVTLSGNVAFGHQSDAASRAVRNIPGVVGLTNDIRVAGTATHQD
ncbi:BON domain-containing protein [Micromonospora sp. CPCC 205371]|nr:BON domain-containing protein [Micromonospora sp. CPCC 205371]